MVRLNDASFNLKIKLAEFEQRRTLINGKSPLIRGATKIFNFKSDFVSAICAPTNQSLDKSKVGKVTFHIDKDKSRSQVPLKQLSEGSLEMENYDDNF